MAQYIKNHPPGAADNAKLGFVAGDQWMDTSVTPADLYQLSNTSQNAASWRKDSFSDNLIVATADSAVVGTSAPVADAILVLNAPASKHVDIQILAWFKGSAAGNVLLNFGLPSGATVRFSSEAVLTGSTYAAALSTGGNATLTVPAASAYTLYRIFASVTMSTTSGTVSFEWGSDGSSATITRGAGSRMTYDIA
jgi:hypothetical protein